MSVVHPKVFLLVGTSRESISASLFEKACTQLGLTFIFIPYAHGNAPDVHGDIIYLRDPFNMGENATDERFVSSLISANPAARYVDNLTSYRDLFFEDKLVQYEIFSDLMPLTEVLTKDDYDNSRYDSSRYVVKERLNAGGKGVFFGSGFSFQDDTYLLQEKLDIQDDYRVICVGKKVLPVALKRAAKRDNESVSKTTGTYPLTKVDIEFALSVLEKVPNHDLVGLDIAMAQGRHHLIEVNRSPQIRIFQNRTGIDVAKMIIERKLALEM